jgi:hypothetical protein
MNIVKIPIYENDDYLIRINVKDIPSKDVIKSKLDRNLFSYYEKKSSAFANKDVNPNIFVEFASDRPSLNSLSELSSLDSTIYTVASEKQNGVEHFRLMQMVKNHLSERPSSRRCMLRMANSFVEYSNSELGNPADVTCLNLIHYFKDKPRLIFRASDVANELLVDILTIVEFFIKPVYDDKQVELSIYASTCQNHSAFWNFVDNYRNLIES